MSQPKRSDLYQFSVSAENLPLLEPRDLPTILHLHAAVGLATIASIVEHAATIAPVAMISVASWSVGVFSSCAARAPSMKCSAASLSTNDRRTTLAIDSLLSVNEEAMPSLTRHIRCVIVHDVRTELLRLVKRVLSYHFCIDD